MRERYERWFPTGTDRRKLFWVGAALLALVVSAYACQGARTWLGPYLAASLEQVTAEQVIARFCEGVLATELETADMLAVYRLQVAELDRSHRRIVQLVQEIVEAGGETTEADAIDLLRACRIVVM